MMANLARDVRLALRGLGRAPVFTVVVVLTLALGIGANVTVFSALRALVLAPLPYPNLDRLVVIRRELVTRGIPYYPAAPADVIDYRAAPGFEDVAGVSSMSVVISEGEGEPERVAGAQVTPGFFAMLGVTPAMGHAFTAEDGIMPNRSAGQTWTPPVVLSHGFWVRRFGADPDILGRSLHLASVTATVVGVLPEGFRFVTSGVSGLSTDRPDVWAPFPIDPASPFRGSFWLYTPALLKPGVTLEQAKEQIRAINQRQRQDFANYKAAGNRTNVVPFQEDVGADVQPMLLALLGAVGFVLLIACVNVSNLLLVRAAGRAREVSIRAALGGGRARIIRQLLAEAGVLAAAGGLAGVALAWGTMPLLARLIPPDLPRVGRFTVEPMVLAFSALATGLAAVVFGVYPALRASRVNLMEALRGRTGEARHAVRARLVVLEVGLSFVLVVGAGLMVRSFVEIRRVDPGFQAKGVLSFRATLPSGAYRTPEERSQVKARMQQSLEAIPGVVSVGAGSSAPLAGDRSAMPYGNEVTATDGDESDFRQAWFRTAMPGYFKTLRTPLLEGRTFTPADSTNYIVVDQRLAEANWPGESAIGKRLYIKITTPPEWFEVIGVVHNQRQASLARETQETIWFSDRTFRSSSQNVWDVRVQGDPAAFGNAVRAALKEVDAGIFVEDMHPLTDFVGRAEAPTALVLKIASAFAGLALLLAVVGLYGVIAYIVRERTAEFGLRMALGSPRAGIFGMVLRQGMVLAAVGVGAGLVGALLLTRAMDRVLVGVAPRDPLTLAAVAAVFAVVTVVACLVPALRALRADPMVALRSE